MALSLFRKGKRRIKIKEEALDLLVISFSNKFEIFNYLRDNSGHPESPADGHKYQDEKHKQSSTEKA